MSALGLLGRSSPIYVMTDECEQRIDKDLDVAEAVGDAVPGLFAPLSLRSTE